MVLPSTAVFFHGTYRGAKSVVPRNTRADSIKVAVLVNDSDDNLLEKLLNNQNHVLHYYFQNDQVMTTTGDMTAYCVSKLTIITFLVAYYLLRHVLVILS